MLQLIQEAQELVGDEYETLNNKSLNSNKSQILKPEDIQRFIEFEKNKQEEGL